MELKHFVLLWHAVINAHKSSKDFCCCLTFHSHLTIDTVVAVSFVIGLDFKEGMSALTKPIDRKEKVKVPSFICVI